MMGEPKLTDNGVQILPPFIKTEDNDPPGGHPVWRSVCVKTEPISTGEEGRMCKMEVFNENLRPRNEINSNEIESIKDEPVVEYQPTIKNEMLEMDTHVLLAEYNKDMNYWNDCPEDFSPKGRQPWPWSSGNWDKIAGTLPAHGVPDSRQRTVDGVHVGLSSERLAVTDKETGDVGLSHGGLAVRETADVYLNLSHNLNREAFTETETADVGSRHEEGIVSNTETEHVRGISQERGAVTETADEGLICEEGVVTSTKTWNGYQSSNVQPTGEKRHACDICDKRFKQGCDLKKHMVTHTGEKPHLCDICGKRFTRRDKLKTHMVTHTGEKRHPCDICGKRFTRREYIKTHMSTHTCKGEKCHSCDICSKKFKDRGSLKKHISTQHTGEKLHSCNICGKGFTNRGYLRRHMLAHTGENPHSCDICGKCYKHIGYAKKHMLTHKLTSEKRHSCDVCGKRFARRRYVNKHMLTHKRNDTPVKSAVKASHNEVASPRVC